MKREEIKLIDNIADIQSLAERVRVLSDDLTQSYFGRELNGAGDCWKISGDYYDCAGVKMEMVLDMIVDIDNELKNMQKKLNSNIAS